MATRFYLRTSGSPPVSPTYGGGSTWNNTGAASRGIMHITKAGTTHTDYTVSADASSGNRTHLVRQFVSPKISSQTISGTVKAQIRGLESSTSFNGKIAINVYRVNSSGTYQDTLLSLTYSDSDTSPYELATSATNRRVYNASESQPITLTSRTFNAGDYLVVEIGIAENGTTTSRTGTLRFGDNNANDLPDDTSSTSDYCPYVEFSADIEFVEVMRGTCGATSTVSGDLSSTKDIEGSIAATSTVTSELNRIVPFVGYVYKRNLITSRNQATCTDDLGDTTGFYPNNAGVTISSSTDYYVSGTKSLKLVSDGRAGNMGAGVTWDLLVPLASNGNYTLSISAINSDNWYIGIGFFDNSYNYLGQTFQLVTADAGNWKRGSVNFDTPNGTTLGVWWFQAENAIANTWYVDNLQCELGTLSDWMDMKVPIGNVTGDLTFKDNNLVGSITCTSSVSGELGLLIQLEGTISVQGSTKNKVPRNQATGSDYNGDLTGVTDLGSTLTSDNTEYHSGSRSFKAITTTNGQGVISDTNNYVPISASTQMTMSAWAKATSQNWYVGIIQYDSSKSQINMEFQWVGNNANWNRGSVTFTSASNGAYARPFASSDGAGTFYFDDFQLEDGTLTTWEEPIPSGSSTVSGDLTKTLLLSGEISSSLTILGDKFDLLQQIISSVSIISSVNADLSIQAVSYQELEGAISVLSNIPDNQILITKNLLGQIDSTSTVIANLNYLIANLTGIISNQSNLPDNQLNVTRDIMGVISAISNLPDNQINYIAGLTGVIDNTSTVIAGLNTNKLIEGLISSQSNVPNALLEIFGINTLAGTISNTSTVDGLLNANYSLTGAINNQSTIQSNTISLNRLIGGNIDSTSSISAEYLSITKDLSGLITNSANVLSTELLVTKLLSGIIDNTLNIPNTDLTIISYFTGLEGRIESHSLTIAELSNAVYILGTISATTNVYGTLIQYLITKIEQELSRIDLVINMPMIDTTVTTEKIDLTETNPAMDLVLKNPYIYFEILYENEII